MARTKMTHKPKREKSCPNEKLKKPKKPKPAKFPLADIRPTSGEHLFKLEDMKEAKEYLQTHGYVVITNVLSPEQQAAIRTQLGTDFAGLNTGIAPDLQTEPTNAQLPGLFSKGISKDPASGLQHSPSSWMVREAAEQTFAALYGEENLVTSFDGMTYFRHLPKYTTDTPWWHVDSNGSECVQGLALLTDTTEYTGGLIVVPGSHRRLQETLADIVDSGKSVKGNYLPLDWTRPALRAMFAECGGARIVTAPKGSITLWDSRLIHSNTCRLRQPTEEEKKTMDGGFSRLGFYVCMLPRDPAWAEHRRGIVSNGYLTNHWPGLEMRAQHLIFPRSIHAMPLTSVALSHEEILARYGRLL
jgi:hypothetical protein